MPKASPILSSFNAGELSPMLDGRVDLDKYAHGCRILENFIPAVQGPIYRRGGTRFVREVKNSADENTWLTKFEFNVEQSYVLEIGDQYIRFYTDHGILLDGAIPYEVVTPYLSADLTNADGGFALSMNAQTGDVIYIAHPKYPLAKLSRNGALTWTYEVVDTTNGPFKDENSDKTIGVYTNGVSGSITITATSAIFFADQVIGDRADFQPDHL